MAGSDGIGIETAARMPRHARSVWPGSDATILLAIDPDRAIARLGDREPVRFGHEVPSRTHDMASTRAKPASLSGRSPDRIRGCM
jgi:thymidylate kinase